MSEFIRLSRHSLRVAALAALLTLGACATAPRAPASPTTPSAGATPSTIRHVVLIRLADPADASELIADMDRLLTPIPGVAGYWRGVRVPVDRSEVAQDFTVGLVIDFADLAAYQAYQTNPRHLELVNSWKPRSRGLTIYDIGSSASIVSPTP